MKEITMSDQRNFLSDDSGAVTVDWVVLTAALVGLGLAVMGVVRGGVADLSGDVATNLKSDGIIRTAFTRDNASALSSAAAALQIDPSRDTANITSMSNGDLANAQSAWNTNAADAQANLDSYISTNGMSFAEDGSVADYGTGDQAGYESAVNTSAYNTAVSTAYNNEATERGL